MQLPRWIPPHIAARLDRVVWRSVGVLAACVTSGILFAKVVEDMLGKETQIVDVPVREWVLAHQSPVATALFTAVTWLGSVVVVVPLVACLGVWLWRRGGHAVAALMIPMPAVAALLIVVLKRLFGRDRPPAGLLDPHLGYSFPSGHTTSATAVALTVGYILMREKMLRASHAIGLALLMAITVGFSRVYLDVHWLTDVAAGWSLGLLIAAFSIGLYDHLRKEPENAGGLAAVPPLRQTSR